MERLRQEDLTELAAVHHDRGPGIERAAGSCTCPMRINIAGSPVDRQKVKKFYTRGLSWPPSGPVTPGDALKTSRADTPPPRQLTATRRALSSTLFLTPPRVVATAAPGRAAPRGASRHGPSIPPPAPASEAAMAWRSPSHGAAGAVATARVSWREANSNCRPCDPTPTASVRRPRLCRAPSHADRPRRQAGGY